MNTLAQRLKFAKRELTNLKTVHQRGLGLLKLYRYFYDIPSSGHQTGFWYLNFTVTFDNSFAAYPFVYMIPTASSSGAFAIAIDQIGFNYSNSGYTAKFTNLYIYNPTSNSFSLVSSAPITSISYEWREP